MKILLFALAAIALWHFIYEGVIAPSIRMHLRNRLFALRDELRAAHAAGGISREDEQAFWFVHNGINSFLNRLSALTVSNIKRIQRAHDADPKLRAAFEDHLGKVLNAKAPVITSVFGRTNEVIQIGMIVNAGGWFIYLVPIAACALLMQTARKAAKAVLLTPQQVLDRTMPVGTRPA